MFKKKENPPYYEYEEMDAYHRNRLISSSKPVGKDRSITKSHETRQSPIFDRSDSFKKLQRLSHPEKIYSRSNTNNGRFCCRTDCESEMEKCCLQADKNSNGIESVNIMTKTQSNSKSEFSGDNYCGNRGNPPFFNDKSFIGWPSESESNSSCDEDETIPMSKIITTKRSVNDRKCLERLSSRSDLKTDTGIKQKKLNSSDSNMASMPVVELSRRGNKLKSKLSRVSKTKNLDKANDVVKFSCDDKINGLHLSSCASSLSDIPGFQKSITTTHHTKLTTPEKDSGTSIKKLLPVTPDLFDSSLSPSGFQFNTVTTPEAPFHSLKCDKTSITSPDSPDIVYLGATGPLFPISSPSSRRKRAGVSKIKQKRKKQKINEKQSEDILQLVEQIDKDEDYAKKLQEEMDKEFAFSLAQGETVHQFPDPQLSLPTLPPYNNGHNNHFHPQPGWQTPTSLHRHNRVPVPHFYRTDMPNGIDIENHLLALLEESPPRRGTRGRRGGRRQPRSRYSVMIQSPIGDGNDYDALLQLAEQMGDVQKKGISNNQINRLPIKKFQKCDKNASADEECSICMCEYEENDCMRILPCFHCFHSGCVDKWLTSNASCPVCRVDINLD